MMEIGNKEGHKIAIIGGGAWGQAVAKLAYAAAREAEEEFAVNELESKKHKIKEIALFSKRSIVAEEISRYCDVLSSSNKNSSIQSSSIRFYASSKIDDVLSGARAAVLAIPAQEIRGFCCEYRAVLQQAILDQAGEFCFILAAKGLELASGALLDQVVRESLKGVTGGDYELAEGDIAPDFSIAALSGPNFADEISARLPALATLACGNSEKLREIKDYFCHSLYKIELSRDLIGVQVAGAFKNIVAIASGMGIALNLGLNFQAALVTRGLYEMEILIEALGGDVATIRTAAGVGDLILTACHERSRNMEFGKRYIERLNSDAGFAENRGGGLVGAATNAVQPATVMPLNLAAHHETADNLPNRSSHDNGAQLQQQAPSNKLAEGQASALALAQLSRKIGLSLPIAEAVHHIIYASSALKFSDIAELLRKAVCS